MRWLLRRCGVYANGYYNYLKNTKRDYHQNKKTIKDKIQDILHSTGGIVGHRGMGIFLGREGINLSKTTVHKNMNKELQFYCIPAKKRPRYIEGKKHKLFPNHLSQRFKIEEKNKVWCTDFTYIKSWDGQFQYNCSILDLLDRSIVATKTSRMMTSNSLRKHLKLHFYPKRKDQKV